jgi:ActR/RegA family two-component response regulator
MEPALAIGFASLSAALHNIRILAKRGLASPEDVEEVYASVMEAVEHGGAPLSSIVEAQLGPQFVLLRQDSRRYWKGA